MSDPHTLYGTPLSLYTGKARSYLIHNRLPYREVPPKTDHFAKQVREAAELMTMPILELADGTVIRDSTAIIDHFEGLCGHAATPKTPCQRVVSRLFDVIGSEGLLRPAMHYRWNFPEENLDFLAFHFRGLIRAELDVQDIAENGMNRMREAAVAFGVTEPNFDLIEGLYRQLLAAFDAHFLEQPYLLGTRPSVGDFGLIAPLYAHLGRDPKPLSLMQAQAGRLFRWVERMNRPELDLGEFAEGEIPDGRFLDEDEIPATLKHVLQHIAMDFVPETLAAADAINRWLASEAPAPGTALQRGVGLAGFEVAGTEVQALAQPYRFYLLQRVHEAFDELDAQHQHRVEALLRHCDMLPILGARLDRAITRQGNQEVWG